MRYITRNPDKLMKKLFAFLVSAALAAITAPAQDWAKARLEKSPRHQEWVKVKSGGREVNCFIVYPEVNNKATAVLVIHEIFGLTDWARKAADDLAEAGYIAIAPDLLSGKAPGGGGTAEMGGNDAAVKAVSSLPPDQVTADLNAVAAYATHLPACNGKLAVAGFCWGGGQSFRYATGNKNLKAAFVFYGPPPEADAMERVNCPVYGFYGGNDNRITSTIPKASEQMKRAGKSYEPVIYEGAGHGFMRAGEAPGAKAADQKARGEAWKRWKQLLRKI
jgi:carboxymethylenebutenolidase